MIKSLEEIIQIKVDDKELKINQFVHDVVKEVNLGILRTLDLPGENPDTFEMKIKIKLPERFK